MSASLQGLHIVAVRASFSRTKGLGGETVELYTRGPLTCAALLVSNSQSSA
jgi:hypothetical protein